MSRIQLFTCGELFCGAGGMSRGFHNVGFRSLFANDLWEVALKTFLQNFDDGFRAKGVPSQIVPLPGSVSDLDANSILSLVSRAGRGAFESGDLDVLLGGPPCQGYSLNAHNRSGDDPRNVLFRDYIRLVRDLSPRVLVLENVPGMFSLDDGRFIEELVESLTASTRNCAGYEVRFRILNAAHYGVPQERFRVVVVGTRRDIADRAGCVELPLPRHYSYAQAHFKGGRSHTFHYAIGHGVDDKQRALALEPTAPLLRPTSVAEAINDLPWLTNGGGAEDRSYATTPAARKPQTEFQRRMRDGADRLTAHWCRVLLPPNTERVKYIPPGGDWRSIPHALLPPGMQRALKKDHTTRYGRLDPDGLSGTILTKPDPHWGTFLHYDMDQQRLLSVREAARIQSFPDIHCFIGGQVDQYRLVGNAVPPLLAEAIANDVRRVLLAAGGTKASERRRKYTYRSSERSTQLEV